MNQPTLNLFRTARVASIALALAAVAAPVFGADPAVQFNRDIRPIITENCFHCHGPDPASRKVGLRLDTKDGFFAPRKDSGPTVIPGKPADSPLYKHISSTDPEEIMPPPKSKKVLKQEEKELIKKWIEQGATWQPHWSFVKPEKSPLPNTKFQTRNAIDNFIFARLEKEGLEPAPEADRRTLARRLSLDLTGLPPEPADVEAFVADTSPNYYEKFVDKLMATPQYGEHRGRFWLDAARYADTHGYHFDNYREIWPYRDWVINAFNTNQRFDQFTIEQFAGDLLPNPTRQQLIATGFHRCAMSTNEGGTIPEENLAIYARERVEATGWVYLGLTANCTVCHDHKFDPITQRDFYSMSAFFRNTTQGAMDGNVKDSNPTIPVPQGADVARFDVLPMEIAAAKLKVESRKKEAQADHDKWLASVKPEDFEKEANPAGLLIHAPLNEGAGNDVTATINSAAAKLTASAALKWKPGGKLGAAPVINSNLTLGNVGDFDTKQPFSYGCWVNIPKGTSGYGAIFARMDNGNAYRGWDLFCNNGSEFAVHIVSTWPNDAFKVATKTNAVKQATWQHLFFTYDGSARPEGAKIYVDGVEQALNFETNNTIKGSIKTTVPLKVGQRNTSEPTKNLQVQDIRVYSRKLDAGEVKSLAQGSHLRAIVSTPADKRTPQQRDQLFDYYLTAKDPTWKSLNQSVAKLEAEKAAIIARSPITHIQQERTDSKPFAHILNRGEYSQPKDKVEPNGFASLHAWPADAPKNRLGLAKWLVSPENPLTPRVTVNRYWQEIFGVGIVRTAEDFGIVGEAPSNQQLLDWLAVEFHESGWDIKHMFKLIVTSATYRQSAQVTALKLEKDPANRLLSRGPRFRMDAEMVRDYALASSGLLVRKIGGPSVRPYQPDNVWEAVAMNESNTRNYKRDTGEALYRRSMYTFWKRAAPPASMDILNAPSREFSCTRRDRTNTPIQALLTMNDPQLIEAARNLAANALKSSAGDVDKTLDTIARRLLARPLNTDESAIVKSIYTESAALYAAKPDDAKKLIAVGESKPDATLPPQTLAAWTVVANQLMNLDEVLNK